MENNLRENTEDVGEVDESGNRRGGIILLRNQRMSKRDLDKRVCQMHERWWTESKDKHTYFQKTGVLR